MTANKVVLDKEGIRRARKLPSPDTASQVGSTAASALSHDTVHRSSSHPEALSPGEVLRLQGTIGNRAVGNLLGRDRAAPSIQSQRAPDHSPSSPNQATPPQVQISAQSEPSIQRVVQSKVFQATDGGFITAYYSTHDTSKLFDDEAKAWEYDSELEKSSMVPFDPFQRYPTNFSYYQTPSHNVMPLSTQGPHTLGHSSLSFRLDKRLSEPGGMKNIWNSQVLNVDKFDKYLTGEQPAKYKKHQRLRYLTDYRILHRRMSKLMGKDKNYSHKKHELMMRLMQLHPYAAYGKGKMSKKALKGKGERHDVGFDSAFDKRAKFRHAARYKKFSEMRKRLFKDDDTT